jgi:hypothetical protein
MGETQGFAGQFLAATVGEMNKLADAYQVEPDLLPEPR